jgi:hypothetical protein
MRYHRSRLFPLSVQSTRRLFRWTHLGHDLDLELRLLYVVVSFYSLLYFYGT